MQHDKAAEGFVFFLVRQAAQVEDFLEFIVGKHPIQQPGTVLALGGLRLAFERANDFLKDISQGQQTLHYAEFIHHQNHFPLGFFQNFQGALAEGGFRDIKWWTGNLLELSAVF